jgi:hypothetical protein
MAKLQREQTHPGIFAGLIYKFNEALQDVVFDATHGTDIIGLDGDFAHTTNVNDSRWLIACSVKRMAITRINTDGSMTNFTTDWLEPNHWENDPVYHIEDWKYEVANGDTRLSYADWVQAQRELEE